MRVAVDKPHRNSVEARMRRLQALLAAVFVLALVNAVVTMLILDNYGAAKRRIESQDRQIRMDARLRRLEGRPPLEDAA